MTAASSSRPMPRSTAVAPASVTSASSIGRLESRICPGASSTGTFPQLVAGGDHPDARTRVRRDLGQAERAEHAEVRGTEHGARVEHGVALVEVAAGGAHVQPRLDLHRDPHAVGAVARGRLHHHDGVGARRDRRAGHDADRLPGTDRHGRCVPGREVAHHVQPDRRGVRRARGVGGPHRVAVHRGVRERRDLLARDDVGREHSPSASRTATDAGAGARHRLRGCGPGRPRVISTPSSDPPAARRVRDQMMPRRRRVSSRNFSVSGPRSSRSSASSMFARRKSTFWPMSNRPSVKTWP